MNCPDEPLVALQTSMSDVLAAYSRVDADGFDRAARAVDQALPCQVLVLPTALVAELHRMKGLIAFTRGDEVASRASLTVARSLDATWQLDETLFPDGHPLRSIYQEALTSFRTDELDESRGHWFVDGVPSSVAPLGYPFVLQAVDEAELVRFTGYIPDMTQVPSLPDLAPDARDLLLEVSIGGLVRQVTGSQTGSAGGLDSGRDGAWTGGALLRVEVDPVPQAGLVVDLGLLANSDPRFGQTGGDGRALLVAGPVWSLPKADVQVRGRTGLAVDSLVGWGNETALPYIVPSLSIGTDLRVSMHSARFALSLDGMLASGFLPFGWRIDASTGARLSSSFAATGGLTFGHRALELVTDDAGTALRTDDDRRLWAGIAVWR